MATVYNTFLPNYYSTLAKNQQQSLIIDNLYWYVGDGTSNNAIGNNNPKTTADEQKTLNQVMYGGRVTPTNMVAMIRRITWQSGIVFDAYDSEDPMLESKKFYCINSLGYVYKCLDNNDGSVSTQEPTTIVPGPFQLSDGYSWIYMYKLTTNQLLDLSIGQYIPMIIDPNVTAAAVKGTVSSIKVVNGGNYSQHATGFVEQIINSKTIRIDNNVGTSSGMYNTMGFYIVSGPGAGSIAQIDNYVANSAGRFVHLDRDVNSIDVGAQYDIAPYINISGNGTGATARAIIDSNEIVKVEIIDAGEHYTIANATVQSNSIYTSEVATVSVNLSPPKGHGGDPYQELYVDDIVIYVQLDDYAIANDLPVNDLKFSKVGLLRYLTHQANNTVYTASSFNNTFNATVSVPFGQFAVGDNIVVEASPNLLSAEVVYANTTNIIGVYHTPYQVFTSGTGIINQNGISGTIVDIVQPQVKLANTDIVAIINTDTIQRKDDSKEFLQMLIKIK